MALAWDWNNLFRPWDWHGIFTHLSIEEAASLVMAGILFYGKYHAKHHGFFHRFAHSIKAQFALDFVCDVMIAIATIQVMKL